MTFCMKYECSQKTLNVISKGMCKKVERKKLVRDVSETLFLKEGKCASHTRYISM